MQGAPSEVPQRLLQDVDVPLPRVRESFAVCAAVECVRLHRAVATAKCGVRRPIEGQTSGNVRVSGHAFVFREERVFAPFIQRQFDSGAGHVPRGIRGARKEVIVVMIERVDLPETVFRAQPFVREHPSIGADDWSGHEIRQRGGPVQQLRGVGLDHGRERHVIRFRIDAEQSRNGSDVSPDR